MNLLIHVIIKTFSYLISFFNLGLGSTIPGQLLLIINPNIISWYQKRLKKGIVLVLGTNGKTTTTQLISNVLKEKGCKVITNESGANLENGIVSSFLSRLNFLANNYYDYGIFEVDELNLQIISKKLKPSAVVFLNLSRDQLDRYAEKEVILKSWQTFIKNNKSAKCFVYKKDKTLLGLKGENITWFDKDKNFQSILKGEFNKINLNASYKVCEFLLGKNKGIKSILENASPIFGRGEKISINKNEVSIFLNKNPASFNQNLKLVKNLSSSYPQDKNILVIGLNDNIADGKDVSWIYDVSDLYINEVSMSVDKFFVVGTRCLDMANRLKYALPSSKNIVTMKNYENIYNYLNENEGLNIYILPTYTSMLNARKILTNSNLGRSITK